MLSLPKVSSPRDLVEKIIGGGAAADYTRVGGLVRQGPAPLPMLLVPGTLAVALMLGGARWGSQIGFGPIFIGDLLVIAALFHFFVTQLYTNEPRPRPPLPLRHCLWWAFIYATARFLISGSGDRGSIRDAAPYTVYVVIGLIAASTMWTPKMRQRTFWVLSGALAFHGAWVFVSTLLDYKGLRTPISNRPLFEIRPDFDYPLMGLLSALILARFAVDPKRRWLLVLAFAACWIPIASATVRAGLLGALTAVAAGGLAIMLSPRCRTDARTWMVVSVPTVAAFSVPLMQLTEAGRKLLDTILSDDVSGTAKARYECWRVLLDWIHSDTVRDVFGSGFSVHILKASGADVPLLGHTDALVRAPHNYWYNTYAQLGLIGVVLFAIPFALVLFSAWRNRETLLDDPLGLLAHLVPICLFFPATFGVVLESPFGAIPYWWCVGIALSYSKDRVQTQDPSTPHNWTFDRSLFRRSTEDTADAERSLR